MIGCIPRIIAPIFLIVNRAFRVPSWATDGGPVPHAQQLADAQGHGGGEEGAGHGGPSAGDWAPENLKVNGPFSNAKLILISQVGQKIEELIENSKN